MTQSHAFKILASGVNVFLTGSAGTGKTFLLNQFIEYLKKNKIKAAVTASTGIAATHLGGITIHSWSGMGIDHFLSDEKITKLAKIDELRAKIKETKVLIIDEISMLDAPRLTLLDRILKAIKEPFRSFGGLQIIVCGDFFQLPPVDRENNKPQYAFHSWIWDQADLRVCYLEEQYRQEDKEFSQILNTIRTNQADYHILNQLKTRLYQPVDYQLKPTKLYTHNADVDAINSYELERMPGEEVRIFEMTSRGPKDLVDFLKKSCLAPEMLELKKGAMVMFVKNNFEQGYVNGTLGQVIDFDEDDYPIVKTKTGQKIIATPMSWNVEENDKIIASIRQIPLRLAWAITVHKSQGMSLDAAEIDLSKSFECGMGYVALSRVKTLTGIKLMGINEMALRVNPLIVERDKEFKELSKQLEIKQTST